MSKQVTALKRLIEHWHGFDATTAPLVHPADAGHIPSLDGFALDLLPYPFVGDITRADVWVLMLNSNVGKDDRADEAKPAFHRRLLANLAQDFTGLDHPFLSLDPALAGTGTNLYYEGRNGFGHLMRTYAAKAGLPLESARMAITQRVAVLQLFPYRSTEGKAASKLSDVLPSARLAWEAAHEAVNDEHSKRLVVIPRCAPDWGFPYDKIIPGKLVTHRSNQARSGSVKPASVGGACAGGDAIIARLLT